MQENTVPGKRPSISRVAIVSGLTRKDIQRILSEGPGGQVEPLERYNRAARVIAGWVRDPLFHETDGNPKVLSLADSAEGFSELVRRHSGDVPARAVLDELLLAGAVEKLPEDRLRLLTRAYVPRASDLDKIEILGTDVADLISTIDHNLRNGGAEPHFQRKVMYDNLPQEALPQFRRLSTDKAQALLEHFDQWLSEHDRDVNQQAPGSGRHRAGIGIYYFEENLTADS